MRALPLLLVLLAAPALAQSPPMLTREPPPGKLAAGTSVLVDDHACPAGQVKLVTAGQNRGRNGRPGKPVRTRRCVARP